MQKPLSVFEVPAASEPEVNDEIDLLGIARTLWIGKHWILICIVIITAAGWYRSVFTATPVYVATTEMALQITSPPAVDIQAVVAGFSGDEASINTEMAIITSGELIRQLVDTLHLEQDPEFNGYLDDQGSSPSLLSRARSAVGQAVGGVLNRSSGGGSDDSPPAEQQRQSTIDAVRRAFSTDSNWDTYVFSISATTHDPKKSILLANTLAEIYRDDQIQTKVDATERMAIWLSGRVGELRAELDNRENEIADLRAKSSLVSDESLQALNEQAVQLRTQLQDAKSGLDRASERSAALQAANASGELDAKLAAAEDGQLDALAAGLISGAPGAQLRFDRRFDQILLQTESQRDRAQERVEELQRAVDELGSQFEGQSSDLQALQQLEQDAEATRVLYETFLSRLKEATVQESAHQADSRMLTEATYANQIAPRPSRTLSLSVLLGAVLGGCLVLLREFIQNTFRTAEDLESRTGRPVLGQIPRIPARLRSGTIQYLMAKPTSAAAEAIRNLRTSVLLSNVDRPPQVIMATSSVPNEGKTTLAISLAQNLAGLNKKVLLIEGDIRRRTFTAYFPTGIEKGGLLSVVTGRQTLEETVFRPEGLSIDVLMGERATINAADLFSSDSFHRFVEQARTAYDYIVIDTPPVLVVPDARVIAQHVDTVLYVVQWDSTSGAQVGEGLKQLRAINAPVAGLVLSRIDPKGMRRYGYGDRYGAYSRYGRKYYDA